jgi:two-component system, OmpR family, sensor histidine kinase KdpD
MGYRGIEVSRVTKEIVARTGRVVLCLLPIAAITWIDFFVLHVNALITGFVYVIAVLIVAARWGLLESLITSFVATALLNYFFLPPVLTWTIADPQNWVALFVFMVTAFTASQLSARARQKTSEALERRAEIERLYDLCLSLMMIDPTTPLGPQITSNIREKAGFQAAAISEFATKNVYFAGDPKAFDSDTLRALAARDATSIRKQTSESAELRISPVSIGGRSLGRLAVIGNPVSDAAMEAVSSLVAIGFEYARQQIEFGKIEVARQNERLRSVLLDALAHDFLTPLTTIKSAITTIRSEYAHNSEEDDILAVVEDETDRLGELTNEATDMARIESGKVHIKKTETRMQELIDAALMRMQNVLEGRRVSVFIQDGIPNAKCDPEMLGLAIRQLLGNAAKYSPQETDIEISVLAEHRQITVEILDHGPGINPEESDLVFERFYRGKQASESLTGTGMGLPIARDIIQAHGGKLWVENAPGAGARFSFTVPVKC